MTTFLYIFLFQKFAIALTICSALILAEVAALPKQSGKAAEIEAVIHDVVHINPRGTVS